MARGAGLPDEDESGEEQAQGGVSQIPSGVVPGLRGDVFAEMEVTVLMVATAFCGPAVRVTLEGASEQVAYWAGDDGRAVEDDGAAEVVYWGDCEGVGGGGA